MYAVLKTGGKQYRVKEDEILRVEKLDAEAGEIIALDQVLLVSDNDNLTVGTPMVDGASVAVEILEQKRARKVIIFKKRRRKSSQRKRGHKQHYTLIRISEILTDNKKPTKKAQGRPERIIVKKVHDITEAQIDQDDNVAPVAAIETSEVKSTKVEKPKAEKVQKTTKKNDGDDLSLLSGVGPVLHKRLTAAGISTFKQIADLDEAGIKDLDEKADLDGRIEREEWQEQARELMDGKAPRAKVDQEKAQKSED